MVPTNYTPKHIDRHSKTPDKRKKQTNNSKEIDNDIHGTHAPSRERSPQLPKTDMLFSIE